MLSPAGYRYLRAELDDLLLKAWDPIGINGLEEAKDEYLAYSTKLSDMLIAGSSPRDLFKYLSDIERVHMGLSTTNAKRMQQVSEHAYCIYKTAHFII